MSTLLAALILPAYAEDPAPPPTVTASIGKGLSVTSADGRYSIGLRARFQVRETVDATQPDADGSRDVTMLTSIRTLRLWVFGNVLDPSLSYTLMLALAPADFRADTPSPIYDAYVDYTRNPNLSLKVGQYFVPFDRLRTVREGALQMADRPQPVSELTLDRDVGVTLYSNHFGGDESPFAYRLGVFGGGGYDVLDGKPPGGLAVLRLELRPLGPIDDDIEGDLERRPAPGLALGIAGGYNLQTNRQKSTFGDTFPAGGVDYLHLDADAVFKWHGFAAEAEYLVRDAGERAVRAVDSNGDPVTDLTISGHGLVTQASFMFTDHHEIVARYSRLWAPDDTDPSWIETVDQSGNELGAGLNWYLDGHLFKIQTDCVAVYGRRLSDAEIQAHLLLDASF